MHLFSPAMIAAIQPKGAGGGGPGYTYRGSHSTEESGTAHSASIDIDAASADRLVVVAVACRADRALTSVTVNGVALTQDKFSSSVESTVGIYSGIVAAGSGQQTVVANWVSSGFILRMLSVFTMTGMLSNVVKRTAGYSDLGGPNGSATIDVDVDDFMIGVTTSTSATVPSFAGSSVAPTAERLDTVYNSIICTADWLLIANNDTFNVTCGSTVNTGEIIVATYH